MADSTSISIGWKFLAGLGVIAEEHVRRKQGKNAFLKWRGLTIEVLRAGIAPSGRAFTVTKPKGKFDYIVVLVKNEFTKDYDCLLMKDIFTTRSKYISIMNMYEYSLDVREELLKINEDLILVDQMNAA
jgi:hypothetical protein